MSATVEQVRRIWIPDVPRSVIEERARWIKPLVRVSRNGLWYIKPVDLFDVAYTWNPKPVSRVRGLRFFRMITTYHSFSYYGLFKPSIGEVLAQIPDKFLGRVSAFLIEKAPETADDLNRNRAALDAGYHVARTSLLTHDCGLM